MPHAGGIVPVMEVGTIVKALRQHLGGTHDYALHRPRAALTTGVVACTYQHLASVGSCSTVSYLFSADACSAFYSSDLVLINCQLYLAVLLGVSMLPEVVGCAHIVVVWLLQMSCGVAVADELHMIF